MLIKIDAIGTNCKIFDDDGNDITDKIPCFRIDVVSEAHTLTKAVIHCYASIEVEALPDKVTVLVLDDNHKDNAGDKSTKPSDNPINH